MCVKKKYISVLLGLFLSFSFVFCSPLISVSADDVSYDFPDTWYSSSSSESTYSIVFDYLNNNPNYNNIIGSKGLTCIAVNGSNVYIQLIPALLYNFLLLLIFIFIILLLFIVLLFQHPPWLLLVLVHLLHIHNPAPLLKGFLFRLMVLHLIGVKSDRLPLALLLI